MYVLYQNNFFIESLLEAKQTANEARYRSDFSTDDDNLLLKSKNVPNSSPQSVSSIPVFSGKCIHLFIYILQYIN